MEVRLLTTLSQWQAFEEDWQDLVAHVIDDNVFYQSWLLLPGLEYLLENKQVELCTIYHEQQCVFMAPFVVNKCYKLFPIRSYSTWAHIHCFLRTPLIRKGYEQQCLQRLIDYLSKSNKPKLLYLAEINGDGQCYQSLMTLVKQQGLNYYQESYQRALLVNNQSLQQQSETIFPKSHMKTIKRRKRRLQELDEVYIGSVVKPWQSHWADEFLRLEASGWKGEQNTAMFCHRKEIDYFKAIFKRGIITNQFQACEIRLANKLIAANISLHSPHGSFAFKTAYDENYSQYGPGILLQLEAIKQLVNSNNPWLDSCTIAGSVEESIWPDKRTISFVAVALRPFPEGVLLKILPGLIYVKRKIAGLLIRVKT